MRVRDTFFRMLPRAIIALLLLSTGFHPAMANPAYPTDAQETSAPMFPLRFHIHGFGAHCYNTAQCKVIYYGHDYTRLFGDKPSGPPPSANYRDQWPTATRHAIPNFPPPAEVSWTAQDGVPRVAKVDIGTIFKDQRVLYSVPDAEIPYRSWDDDPDILLEVNDRTISVYMKAFIATKTEQIPGNPYSNAREDVILAWTRTY